MARDFQPLMEQTEYLRGVLCADKEVRLCKDLDPGTLDPYGTGNRNFWRGMLEAGGRIAVYASQGDRAYPRVELKASLVVLTSFLAFLQEEIYTRKGLQWQWDADGKLAWQALGEFLRFTGQKAQDIIRVLYLGCSVSQDSCRGTAEQILQWTTRR
jgi:hypothetical protein